MPPSVLPTKFLMLGVLLSVCISLASCSRSNNSETRGSHNVELVGTLHVTGSSTISPMMQKIGTQFTALHPKVKMHIESGGSARGLSDVRDAKADIGMVAHVISDRENLIKGFPMARDGVGLIVHRDNPVKNLTSIQIKKIFTHQIRNWSEIGGSNTAIVVINRDEGRGVTDLFLNYFQLKYSQISADTVLGDNSTVDKVIAAQPGGITFFSVVTAERFQRTGSLLHLVSLDGITATRANILNGNYPLTRPLTLVTRDLPRGLAKSFIEYCLSPQVTDIIEEMGFVPYEE